jgi:nucleolar complex protein 3
VKNRAHNVHPDILETLLVLNLKDVNLDEEKEQDIKQKKLMARKQKVLQMSKRERKVCS